MDKIAASDHSVETTELIFIFIIIFYFFHIVEIPKPVPSTPTPAPLITTIPSTLVLNSTTSTSSSYLSSTVEAMQSNTRAVSILDSGDDCELLGLFDLIYQQNWKCKVNNFDDLVVPRGNHITLNVNPNVYLDWTMNMYAYTWSIGKTIERITTI